MFEIEKTYNDKDCNGIIHQEDEHLDNYKSDEKLMHPPKNEHIDTTKCSEGLIQQEADEHPGVVNSGEKLNGTASNVLTLLDGIGEFTQKRKEECNYKDFNGKALPGEDKPLSDNKENKKIIGQKREQCSESNMDCEDSHTKCEEFNEKMAVETDECLLSVNKENTEISEQKKEKGSDSSMDCEVSHSKCEELDPQMKAEHLNEDFEKSTEQPEQICGGDVFELMEEILEKVVKECEILKCDVCEEKFDTISELTIHLKIHPKPCICRICNKLFATNSHLKRHSTSHSGERPYKCEVCGKDFTQSSNLIRHTRTHTREKTYKWTVCHKLFKTSCYSQVHTRSNTGEKTYKCKACNKDFPHSVRLIRHTKIHTLKNPFNFGGKPVSGNDLVSDVAEDNDKQDSVIGDGSLQDNIATTVLQANGVDFNNDLPTNISGETDLPLNAPDSSIVTDSLNATDSITAVDN